jgi:hypothetical protein
MNQQSQKVKRAIAVPIPIVTVAQTAATALNPATWLFLTIQETNPHQKKALGADPSMILPGSTQ